MRAQLGDGCDFSWEQFENKVNVFSGDVHKRTIGTAFNLRTNVLIISQGLDANWKNDPLPEICNIRNIKTKPDQYPEAMFLKNSRKVVPKPKKSL